MIFFLDQSSLYRFTCDEEIDHLKRDGLAPEASGLSDIYDEFKNDLVKVMFDSPEGIWKTLSKFARTRASTSSDGEGTDEGLLDALNKALLEDYSEYYSNAVRCSSWHLVSSRGCSLRSSNRCIS